jgi:hypothetical protein
MNHGKIYVSVDDLMQLMGSGNRRSAYNYHKTIRESIQTGKKNLTILEYCRYFCENYYEIYIALRGEPPKNIPPDAP